MSLHRSPYKSHRHQVLIHCMPSRKSTGSQMQIGMATGLLMVRRKLYGFGEPMPLNGNQPRSKRTLHVRLFPFKAACLP